MNDNDASTENPQGPAARHAEYRRQAAQHFGGASLPAPQEAPPAIFRPEKPQSSGVPTEIVAGTDAPTTPLPVNRGHTGAPGQGDEPAAGPPFTPAAAEPYPSPFGSPPADVSARSSAQSMPSREPQQYPAGSTTGPDAASPGGVSTRAAGAAPLVLASLVLFALLILRSPLVSFPAAILVTFADAAIVLGYLAFRQYGPDGVRDLEMQILTAADRFAAKLVPMVSNAANPPSGPTGNTPALYSDLSGQMAGPTPMPPTPGYGPYSGFNYPQPPNPSAFTPVGAGPIMRQPNQQAGGQILLSIVLVAASLVPYAIIYNASSFSSVWQRWWISISPIVALIIIIAARPRPGANRALALLFACAGAAVYVFATVPAESWGMNVVLSDALLKGNHSWSDVQNLALWVGRLPILTVAVFVVAWGIARRRHPAWLLGLIPTGAAIAFAIWYSEHGTASLGSELQDGSIWFVAWLIAVGPFTAGCLACWAADVLLAPRPPGPYPGAVVPPY